MPKLEDHPRTCKRLGITPIRYAIKNPFGMGCLTLLGGLTITMVINHLLNGMILQVGCTSGVWNRYGSHRYEYC